MPDLIGDLITLFCWRWSRKPPSETYPRGYAKFEVLGTVAVSVLLTGGALGLGLHSLSLLSDSLAHTAAHLQPGLLHDILVNVTSIASSVPAVGHEHSHAHALDPNAAWFALVGVLVKEWLFRATDKVAKDEGSSVLRANALHHRSDAYSSGVALLAILGTWWWPALPLDQLGGDRLFSRAGLG
jgi:divalent metal cation (Fe/Co/Zn/Cd) transporter